MISRHTNEQLAAIDNTIALLESVPDKKFNMRDFFRTENQELLFEVRTSAIPRDKFLHRCGTAACVAGFIVAANKHEGIDVGLCAQRLLGLTDHSRADMFTPPGFSRSDNAKRFTRKRAIAMLKHYRKTGVVRWGIKQEGVWI